jgi:hypothetical protein
MPCQSTVSVPAISPTELTATPARLGDAKSSLLRLCNQHLSATATVIPSAVAAGRA